MICEKCGRNRKNICNGLCFECDRIEKCKNRIINSTAKYNYDKFWSKNSGKIESFCFL